MGKAATHEIRLKVRGGIKRWFIEPDLNAGNNALEPFRCNEPDRFDELIAIPKVPPPSLSQNIRAGECTNDEARDWCLCHPEITLREMRQLLDVQNWTLKAILMMSVIFERLKAEKQH